ncbi:C2 family cysteine protease [Janibacter anophelis]|uniref:C2 family cysteine protease n=1 Tax=Janibacter anophelis TaxID=319054 RepID=UPI000DEF93DE|nr:C2 family cysteine protease [Janibacter anophelis]
MINEGMDAVRVRQIAADLRGQGERLTTISQQGSAQLRTLQEVWQGNDLDHFGQQWQSAERQVHVFSDRLTGFADELARQVEDQQGASGETGGRGRGRPPGGPIGDAEGGQGPHSKPDPSDSKGSKTREPTQPEERIDGPLFAGEEGEEVQPDDVEQGDLADCWFITSMQAVAATNPELIKDNVTDNGDGTYTVTLYEDGEPVEYVVTPDFPAHEGNPQYADNPGERELWPLLYEKAMAQHMGGSWEDMNYDTAERGIEAMTGQDAHTEGTGSGFLGLDPPPSADEIRDIVNSNGQVALSSHDNADGRPAYQGEDAVATNHIYWVQEVKDDGTLVIVNPWDPSEPAHEMSYDEYRENFSHITTSQP